MRTLLLFLIFTAHAFAADGPPAPKPVPVEIVLPPTPKPPPAPLPLNANPKVFGDSVYDIRCTGAAFVVRAYPADLVTIAKEVIPAGESLRVKDNFTDGAKTHVYKGPMTVYSVRPAGTGTVQVVITPVGFKLESEIKTVPLDVNNGTAPQPPPGPKPPTPQPVASFRVLIVRESGATHSAAQMAVMDGKAVQDYLAANCNAEGTSAGWRRYDAQQDATGESPSMKALWAAVQPKLTSLPCIVIEVNGKADILPLSATPAEQVAVLRKYREGK